MWVYIIVEATFDKKRYPRWKLRYLLEKCCIRRVSGTGSSQQDESSHSTSSNIISSRRFFMRRQIPPHVSVDSLTIGQLQRKRVTLKPFGRVDIVAIQSRTFGSWCWWRRKFIIVFGKGKACDTSNAVGRVEFSQQQIILRSRRSKNKRRRTRR